MPDLPFNKYTVFEQALGLEQPWSIKDVQLSQSLGRLDIYLQYTRGCTFACSQCNQSLGIYRTRKRTWKHLNFFQYEAYLHVKLPEIQCPDCGITRAVPVSWARPNSGFTLLFEALTLELAQVVPLSIVGGILAEYSDRLFRIITYYVNKAREKLDFSQVSRLCIDETSKRKGHNYITVFTDPDKQRVLFATSGKDHMTVKRFNKDFKQHGGDPEKIKACCIDLSPAFLKGVKVNLPQAEITIDPFHVIALMNEAVDKVRRQEVKDQPLLKHSRYAVLKNPDKLTEIQEAKLTSISKAHLKTGRAYQIRLALQEIYRSSHRQQAETLLKKWYFWATHSRLKPVIKIAKTIKKHWDKTLNHFTSQLSNGLSEGINSIIQGLKRRARGYKNTENLITMVYLLKGKLQFDLQPVTQLTYYR